MAEGFDQLMLNVQQAEPGQGIWLCG